MQRNDIEDWYVVYEAYRELGGSPAWKDVLSDIKMMRKQIMMEAAQGKITSDQAIFGIWVIERIIGIPESAMRDAQGEAERVAEESDLAITPTDLESQVPSSLF